MLQQRSIREWSGSPPPIENRRLPGGSPYGLESGTAELAVRGQESVFNRLPPDSWGSATPSGPPGAGNQALIKYGEFEEPPGE